MKKVHHAKLYSISELKPERLKKLKLVCFSYATIQERVGHFRNLCLIKLKE